MSDRVQWRGVTVDQRTAQMLDEVARLAGPLYINPTQGSWSGSVAASAGTHAGCGAVDLLHRSWSPQQYDQIVDWCRQVGFAAWHRTPQQSNWPRHCHAIAVQPGGKNDRGCLSAGANQQVINYYDGLNGLAGRAPDDGPRGYVGRTWETYLEEHMPLTDKEIDKIADVVAARVNRTLGDYNSKGDPSGPNKDDPKLAADYIRQIRRLVGRK